MLVAVKGEASTASACVRIRMVVVVVVVSERRYRPALLGRCSIISPNSSDYDGSRT